MGRYKDKKSSNSSKIGIVVHVSRYFADPKDTWEVLSVSNEGRSDETYTLKNKRSGEVQQIYAAHTYRTTSMRIEQTRQALIDKKTRADKIGRKETK